MTIPTRPGGPRVWPQLGGSTAHQKPRPSQDSTRPGTMQEFVNWSSTWRITGAVGSSRDSHDHMTSQARTRGARSRALFRAASSLLCFHHCTICRDSRSVNEAVPLQWCPTETYAQTYLPDASAVRLRRPRDGDALSRPPAVWANNRETGPIRAPRRMMTTPTKRIVTRLASGRE